MNRKKKIIIGSLVLIVIIMILCVFGYLIYRGKYNKISNTINQSNNKAELSTELKEQKVILIKEQFLAKLKEIDKISDEKLLDYRVDEVKILSESEKQVFADKIKEQFLEKLKESDNISQEKLLDYRVDEVRILSESEKQAFNEKEEYSTEDILAFVKYSVKPKNIEDTVWIAGNGEIDGEWIINKTACECLRNGKLVKSSGFSTGF